MIYIVPRTLPKEIQQKIKLFISIIAGGVVRSRPLRVEYLPDTHNRLSLLGENRGAAFRPGLAR